MKKSVRMLSLLQLPVILLAGSVEIENNRLPQLYRTPNIGL